MPETYEVGVAAIVVLLILREVFTYLRTLKQTNGTDKQEHEMLSILRQQLSILDELKTANVLGAAAQMRVQFTLEEVKQEQLRMRENIHDVRDIMNVIAGRRHDAP